MMSEAAWNSWSSRSRSAARPAGSVAPVGKLLPRVAARSPCLSSKSWASCWTQCASSVASFASCSCAASRSRAANSSRSLASFCVANSCCSALLRRVSMPRILPRVCVSSCAQSLLVGPLAVGFVRAFGNVGGAEWSASLPGPGSLAGPGGGVPLRPRGREFVAHRPRGGVADGLRERLSRFAPRLLCPPGTAGSRLRCATMFVAVAVPGLGTGLNRRTGCCASCCGVLVTGRVAGAGSPSVK